MLSVSNMHFMLNVNMLNVIMLSVAAPLHDITCVFFYFLVNYLSQAGEQTRNLSVYFHFFLPALPPSYSGPLCF
jgi:hypothetical protein